MDGRVTEQEHGLRARAGGFGVPARLWPAARDLAATDLPRRAAALGAHGALCLLAAFAGVAAVFGMAGTYPATSDAVLEVLRAIGATSLADLLEGPVADLVRDKQLAVLLLVAGFGATAALTSLYRRAFERAAQPVAGADDDPDPPRGPLPALARVTMATTLVVIGLCAITTGAPAQAIGAAAGISGDAVVAWDIVKWPILLVSAFVVFAALQRSAIGDPRVLASSSVAFSQVFAVMVWLLAITGFVLYLVSFGSFQDTYGTVGSGIVLLVWVTMFSMLYYATPDLRVEGIGTLAAGAALSAIAWLVSCALLAVCVGVLDGLANPFAAVITGLVFLFSVWLSTAVLLLGVQLNARGFAPSAPRAASAPTPGAAPAPPQALPGATPSGADTDDLFGAVSSALQNDVAHDTMLSPVEHESDDRAARLSDFELDLSDWGFTYGVAWATARAQAPGDPDEEVAARALAAAGRVFRLYCGDPDWAQRVPVHVGGNGEGPQHAHVPANGRSGGGNGHGRFSPSR